MNLMEKRSKITFLDYSSSLIQEDYIPGRSMYYDTQVGSLIRYLTSTFPIFINLIGLSTNLKFRVRFHEKCQVTQLPNLRRIHPIVSIILFNLISFLYLIFNQKPSIVYVKTVKGTNPYLGALLYAKLMRIPIFLDLRNPLASVCSDRPMSLYEKMVTKITDRIYIKYSNKIIHISKKSKCSLKSNPKLFQKSLVVPSCAKNIFFTQSQRKGTENKVRTFAYWGIISKIRRLDVVILAFMKAKKLNYKFNAKLYLIGDGQDIARLKKLVRTLNTQDVVFKGYFSTQEELSDFLRDISVAVIPYPKDEFFQYCSPLKLAEAIAMELPIMASDIEPNRILKEYNLGILCNNDEDSYARAFLKFWSFSKSDLNQFRKNCARVKHLFTPENVFKELGDAIRPFIEERI